MLFDKPFPTSSAEMEMVEREEMEALERMARATRDSSFEEDPTINMRMEEFARLAAGELVMLARHPEAAAMSRNELERSRLAQSVRRLAAELLHAARVWERYRPDDETPKYLQEGSTISLRGG